MLPGCGAAVPRQIFPVPLAPPFHPRFHSSKAVGNFHKLTIWNFFAGSSRRAPESQLGLLQTVTSAKLLASTWLASSRACNLHALEPHSFDLARTPWGVCFRSPNQDGVLNRLHISPQLFQNCLDIRAFRSPLTGNRPDQNDHPVESP